MTPVHHNTEAGGQGRGQGAAVRCRGRGEWPGLAGVSVRGLWAARWCERPTLESRAAGRCAIGSRAGVEPVAQEGSGVVVHAHHRSHSCRVRWAERAPAVLLRWQCRGWRGAMCGLRDRLLVLVMRKLRSTLYGMTCFNRPRVNVRYTLVRAFLKSRANVLSIFYH